MIPVLCLMMSDMERPLLAPLTDSCTAATIGLFDHLIGAGVIVCRVRSQQMVKMPLAQHDKVVKTFLPDRRCRSARSTSDRLGRSKPEVKIDCGHLGQRSR